MRFFGLLSWLGLFPVTRQSPVRRRCLPGVECLEDRLAPAVITVTTLADPIQDVYGQVSIRDAIKASNSGTSVNGSAAGTGNDTIQFAAGLMGTIDLTQI